MTALDICNAALLELGKTPIPGIDRLGTDAQRMCAMWYHPIRREALCLAVWRFAAGEYKLLPSGPAVDGRHQYNLPDDCIRVLGVYLQPEDWMLQGRTIWAATNGRAIRCDLVRDTEDLEAAPPAFVRLLTVMLARRLTPCLLGHIPPDLYTRLDNEKIAIVEAVRPTLREYREYVTNKIER